MALGLGVVGSGDVAIGFRGLSSVWVFRRNKFAAA